MKRTPALIAVIVAAIFFGTLAILTPLAYRVGIQPLTLLTWRFFFASVIIGILALRRNRSALRVNRHDLVRYFALSLFGYGASSLCFFTALKHADAPVVSSLLYAYPAIVAIAAAVFFKERIAQKQWYAIVSVLIGCVLVLGLIGGAAHVEPFGAALAILAACFYASFNLLSQKWLPGRSSMTMMTYTFGISSLLFALATIVTSGPATLFSLGGWSLRAWILMALIIIFPTVCAILLYLRGVRQLGASQAAVVSTLEPLFTVIFAWIILGQTLGVLQILGVAFVVAGVAASAIITKVAEPGPTVPLSEDEIVARPMAQEPIVSETITPETDDAPPLLYKMSKRRRRMFGFVLGVIGFFVLLEVSVLAGFAWLLNSPIPDITLKNIAERSSQTSVIYAADGSELARWRGDEERTPVPASEISKVVMDATVAIEDRRFYEHAGVDPKGVLRALKRNTEEGVIKQGGSTITQQLIKMLYTGGERTLTRKIREAIMATRAEMGYEKTEIMAGYLNMAYYGHGAYGIESAAREFFGKTVSELSLPEAAMLAGMLNSPSSYNPFTNPAPVKARRDLVLDAMVQSGLISPDQSKAARNQDLGLKPLAVETQASRYPFFVDYVRRELETVVDEEVINHGGLKIYTTIDPAIQDQAESSAKVFSSKKDPEVSIVSVRYSDGAVLAMVGGRDWKTSQYNLAVQGKRQPGSAFKPFVLIPALEAGIPLEKSYSAAPFTTPVKDGIWKVNNYNDSKSELTMTLRQATTWSVNTVYARLIMEIGPDKVVSTAKALGISSEIDPDPAIALGGLKYGASPLEMASAYGTMARRGKLVEPSGIVKIIDRDGKQIYAPTQSSARVFSAATGKKVGDVLHEVVTQGTGQASKIGTWSAGKTGTTQSYRDAWFVGWSNGVSTAVWMGYPKAQIDMTDIRGRQVTGGSFPAEIWADFMSKGQTLRPLKGFAISEDEGTPAPSNPSTATP